MDNDTFMVQMLKNYIRTGSYRIQYLGKKIYSIEDGSTIIKQLLLDDKPFMLCRIGAVEGRTIEKYITNKKYSSRDIQNIKTAAGVFPNKIDTIDRFCETYLTGIASADGFFTWGCVGESKVIKKYAKRDALLLKNDTYNVLFYNDPWTLALKNKKILVVHPFVDTIKSQYEKRQFLFSSEILPEFKKLSLVKAVQSNAGEDKASGFNSWFDALDHMKDDISKQDFEVALIGAGAYGIPLAKYIKDIGKQAIHMAGNLQILFGIRGKRWDNFPQYIKYFNKYWVYPSNEETPKNKGSVEGGSYWK